MSAPFIPLYVADYLADTSHLTTLEHGAYMLILMAVWRAGGNIPDDDKRLAAICKLTPDEWREISATIKEFFTVKSGKVSHKRIDKELVAYNSKIEQKKTAAEKRWNKSKDMSHADASNAHMREPCGSHAGAMLTQNSELNTKKQTKKEIEDPVFNDCWKAFPHVKTRMSKSKALAEYSKLPPDEQKALPQAIKSFSSGLRERDREYVPAMERWLRDGKHRPFLPDAEGACRSENRVACIEAYRATGIWHSTWGDDPTPEELGNTTRKTG